MSSSSSSSSPWTRARSALKLSLKGFEFGAILSQLIVNNVISLKFIESLCDFMVFVTHPLGHKAHLWVDQK